MRIWPSMQKGALEEASFVVHIHKSVISSSHRMHCVLSWQLDRRGLVSVWLTIAYETCMDVFEFKFNLSGKNGGLEGVQKG